MSPDEFSPVWLPPPPPEAVSSLRLKKDEVGDQGFAVHRSEIGIICKHVLNHTLHLEGRLERPEVFIIPKDDKLPDSCWGHRHDGVMGMLMMVLRLRMEEVLPLAG